MKPLINLNKTIKSIRHPIGSIGIIFSLFSIGFNVAAADNVIEARTTNGYSEARLSLGIQSWDAKASWNTAADITGVLIPNVLSELTYDDLEVTPLALQGELILKHKGLRLLLGFEAIGGDIDDGRNRDSDYLSDNRTNEWSRSQSDVNGDEVREYDIYIGLMMDYKAWSLTLLSGWQKSEQALRKQNGVQLICLSPCIGSPGPFAGLNSVYRMTWRGPWFGGRLTRSLGKHALTLAYEYHIQTDYRGEATWNLRSDLQQPISFVHDADASGEQLKLSYNYRFNQQWRLTVSYQYTQWQSDSGVETRFFSNGSIGKTRLNRADWEADSVGVAISYSF